MKANEITSFVNEFINKIEYNREPETLYNPIKYVLSLGGKRIRPVMMMLSFNLFKDNPEEIINTAVALETYHNYTLLHDDLMDNADLRRGNPTVHKKWNASTAVLSGDTMLVLAYERMMKCAKEKQENILKLFTETALQIGEGQQYDMDFENKQDVTEEEYIEMIRLKTSVLIACATKMGAILANASKEDAELLYKFGELFGLAFQLQDDYLDVYGDTSVFGKQIGGDIVSNKKTYMLITALRLANKEQRDEMECWINKKTFNEQEKIKAITNIYNQLNIKEKVNEKIDGYFLECKKHLDKVNVPQERKQELLSYVEKMMHRQV